MKEVTLHRDQLKKLDYPYELPADAAEIVRVSPEVLLVSVAMSLKRIADVLDDGLTHLDPKSGGVFGLADIAAEAGRKFDAG